MGTSSRRLISLLVQPSSKSLKMADFLCKDGVGLALQTYDILSEVEFFAAVLRVFLFILLISRLHT